MNRTNAIIAGIFTVAIAILLYWFFTNFERHEETVPTGMQAEARRKQSYLSDHITPTLAETAAYPERYILGGLVLVVLFLVWVVLAMIGYNIKDRR